MNRKSDRFNGERDDDWKYSHYWYSHLGLLEKGATECLKQLFESYEITIF